MQRGRSLAALGGLLVVYCLALWPWAGTLVLHHTDEKNYTDAALVMLGTGDWLTPRWSHGEPRLHKPILTYWATAGSFRAVGVSVGASRLPFIVAGALVVALTYALAMALTRSRPTAHLAALILLSAHQFLLASMRAMPDVLLTLFLLVSAWGFLRLVALGPASPAAHWAAWGGAALAVATKGLLPLALVAFAGLFAWLARGERPRGPALRPSGYWPSLIAATVVAGGWYALMAWRHGARLLDVFIGDQVARKVGLGIEPLWHVPFYALLMAVNLLPWSLLALVLLVRDRSAWRTSDPDWRRARRFMLGWCALLAIVFGVGRIVDPRYVLPAAPLLAIVLADTMERAGPLKGRLLRLMVAAALLALALVGLGLAALTSALLGPAAAFLPASLFLLLAGALALLPRRLGLGRPTVLALAVLLALPAAGWSLRRALEPERGVAEIARLVEAAPRPTAEAVAAPELRILGGKLRLLTGGRVPIDTATPLPADRSRWPHVLIVDAADAVGLDLLGYAAREIAGEARALPPAAVLAALLGGDPRAALDAQRRRYVVAVRR